MNVIDADIAAPPVVASRGRWLISLVLLAVVISGFFDRINVAVMFTNTDFQSAMGMGFEPARLGLLMSAFLFAYGLSSIALSFCGDTLGPRRSLLASIGVWGVLMGFMGTASSYASMIGARIVLGAAEGPQFSLFNKITARWFPVRERARATAMWLVGSPLGSAIGFPLTVFLVGSYGWRSSFFVCAAINLVVVLPLVYFMVQDRPPNAKADAPVMQPTSRRSIPAELRVLMANRGFWLMLVFNSGLLIYLWGLNTWLPSYLQRVRHFDPRELGWISSLPFVAVLIGQFSSATISDRTGRRALTCCVGLTGAAVFMLATVMVSNAYLAVAMLALSGGFWGASVPSAFAVAQTMIPGNILSTGIGVFNGVGNLAGACAPFAMGLAIAEFGTIEAGLYVIVAAALIGALAMIPLLRKY